MEEKSTVAEDSKKNIDNNENHKTAEILEEPIESDKIEEEVTDESIVKLIKEDINDEQSIASILKNSSSVNITIFKDRVSGNVNSGNGKLNIENHGTGIHSPSIDESLIIEEEIVKINGVYEPIPEYFEAKGKLRKHGLIILFNEIHTSKRTTAIRLLSEKFNDRLRELGPIFDIKDLDEFQFQNNIGYLIDGIATEFMSKFNEVFVRKLNQKLIEAESKLIITYNNDSMISDDLSDYKVKCSKVKEPAKALINHIEFKFYDSEKCMKMMELLKDEEFYCNLNSGLGVNEIEKLVNDLEQAIEGSKDKSTILHSLSLSVHKRVDVWFDKNKGIEEICLIAALAVFEESQLEVVVNAAIELRKFIGSNQPGTLLQANNIMFTRRDDILKLLNAEVEKSQKNTEAGLVDIQLIRFKEEDLAKLILKQIWMQYDLLKKPLLDWLIFYSNSDSFDNVQKVAQAVSKLVKIDLAGIKENFIIPCAKSTSLHQRLAVAIVLDSMVKENEQSPFALSILHNWILGSNKELVWTAAAAYGGVTGLVYVDRALKDLWNILKSKDIILYEISSICIGNIFEFGKIESQYYIKIMDKLLLWSKSEDKVISRNSIYIFLEISKKRVGKFKGKYFPRALANFSSSDEFKMIVVELWKIALNESRTRELAIHVLRYLVLLGDKDDVFYDHVEYFIVSLYSSMSTFERNRLRSFIEKLALYSKEKSITARMLHVQLKGSKYNSN